MGKQTPDELISKLGNLIHKSKKNPLVRLTISRSIKIV